MEPRDIGSRISPSGFREKTLPTNGRDLSLTKSATTLKYAKCSFQNKRTRLNRTFKPGFVVNVLISVRLIGLEPTRLTTPDPKSGAATNYATGARFSSCGCKYTPYFSFRQIFTDSLADGMLPQSSCPYPEAYPQQSCPHGHQALSRTQAGSFPDRTSDLPKSG